MKYNKTVGNINIKLNTNRLDENIREAQKMLNMRVVGDCDPFIPHLQGDLRGSQRYPEGIYGGEITWETPYAHYQYEGLIYEDPELHAGGIYTEGYGWWSRPGIKKVQTERKLTYHTAGTSDHWFEKAKEQNLNQWVDLVKRTAGKE